MPFMYSELRSHVAWTLICELKHLEKVIFKALGRKREIEDVLKMMNPSVHASAFIVVASNPDGTDQPLPPLPD